MAPLFSNMIYDKPKKHILPCQHCGVPVERSLNMTKANCFPCKMRIKKEYNLTHKKAVPIKEDDSFVYYPSKKVRKR